MIELWPYPRRSSERAASDLHRRLIADAPPDVTHTRVLGQFDGVRLDTWNDFVRHAVAKAIAAGWSPRDLQVRANLNVVDGCHLDRGFRHIPEARVSVQAVDANQGLRAVTRIAEALDVPLDFEIIRDDGSDERYALGA